MEENEEQVSRNIKSMKVKFGLTNDKIAERLNVSSKTYMTIENNPFSYDMNKLIDVANAIGCNINDFFLKG